MASESLEVSSTGIKFSYHRYLSDTAAGFLLLVIMLILGVSSDQFRNAIAILPTTLQVSITLILLLLATPLGIVINALAWFIWGGVSRKIEFFYFHQTLITKPSLKDKIVEYFLRPTKNDFMLNECFVHFGLTGNVDSNKYFTMMTRFDNILAIYYPEVYQSSGHLWGLEILLRNIAFLILPIPAIPFAMLKLVNDISITIFICCLIFIVGLISSALVGFYVKASILFDCYTLHQRIGSAQLKLAAGQIDAIADSLIANSVGRK